MRILFWRNSRVTASTASPQIISLLRKKRGPNCVFSNQYITPGALVFHIFFLDFLTVTESWCNGCKHWMPFLFYFCSSGNCHVDGMFFAGQFNNPTIKLLVISLSMRFWVGVDSTAGKQGINMYEKRVDTVDGRNPAPPGMFKTL